MNSLKRVKINGIYASKNQTTEKFIFTSKFTKFHENFPLPGSPNITPNIRCILL